MGSNEISRRHLPVRSFENKLMVKCLHTAIQSSKIKISSLNGLNNVIMEKKEKTLKLQLNTKN
jgi:hypothetical protein